jgi:hypothetical protein
VETRANGSRSAKCTCLSGMLADMKRRKFNAEVKELRKAKIWRIDKVVVFSGAECRFPSHVRLALQSGSH